MPRTWPRTYGFIEKAVSAISTLENVLYLSICVSRMRRASPRYVSRPRSPHSHPLRLHSMHARPTYSRHIFIHSGAATRTSEDHNYNHFIALPKRLGSPSSPAWLHPDPSSAPRRRRVRTDPSRGGRRGGRLEDVDTALQVEEYVLDVVESLKDLGARLVRHEAPRHRPLEAPSPASGS